jgi:Flp pilus assembly protein TadG
MTSINSSQKSRKRGQSLVELVVGIAVLIPVMLLIFDLAVIVIAVQMNDSTCREAARVAASGSPSDVQQRANAIISRANVRATGMMSNFTLVSYSNTAPANYMSTIGQFGGPINGTVTIQTEVDVKPFIVQWAYNGISPLKFRSQQSFPFTYVMPNTTGTTTTTPPLTP